MADLVIDCASGGPATVVSAIYVARKSGRIILGGRKFKTVPEFNSDLLITRFLTVKGMRGHSYQSVELALSIIAGGTSACMANRRRRYAKSVSISI